MATRIIYICDKCKKESEHNDLTHYELIVETLNGAFRAKDTRALNVCYECSKELKKPFLGEEE